MPKLIDLTGQRFGRLVVMERAGVKNKVASWLCKCDCGKMKIINGQSLRKGYTQSCGCLRKETSPENGKRTAKHNGRSRLKQQNYRLYYIWDGMKQRCNNPNNHSFQGYGGRGIRVCEEWLNDFAAFQTWALAHGYADDLTIDRIDNYKGYSPDNCQWITIQEQQHHRRKKG